MPKQKAIPVEVVAVDGGYQLHRGGHPYQVRGAGMESGQVAMLAAHGGNSLRTWSTDNDYIHTKELLDEAASVGVTVALCLNLGRERHGFDYTDKEAVARQLQYARQEVMRYKDHPALLMWIIGNELNHSFTQPEVFDAVNDISLMIHAVDGNHPTTTALAGFSAEMVGLLEQRAPDLDFPSFQLYAAIDELPRKIREAGFTKPFMITEWGATGHWEVALTKWGAPIEATSTEKAQQFLDRYERVILRAPKQIIGSYVFFWGQKQERTPTWYGIFLEDGARTEAMDAMHFIWNGEWPAQRAPQVKRITLDGKSADQSVVLEAGVAYGAKLDTFAPDGGDFRYEWQIMRESESAQQGGDPEAVPEIVPVPVDILEEGRIKLISPDKPGAYRLFAHVYDSAGHAGHANIPFFVGPLH